MLCDSNNLCNWSMRCLLVETAGRRILIDTGMGDKQNERFFSHYEPSGPTLAESLAIAGFVRCRGRRERALHRARALLAASPFSGGLGQLAQRIRERRCCAHSAH